MPGNPSGEKFVFRTATWLLPGERDTATWLLPGERDEPDDQTDRRLCRGVRDSRDGRERGELVSGAGRQDAEMRRGRQEAGRRRLYDHRRYWPQDPRRGNAGYEDDKILRGRVTIGRSEQQAPVARR